MQHGERQLNHARRPAVDGLFEVESDGTVRLLYSRCLSCGAQDFPVRESCGACLSSDVVREFSASTGRMHAFTVIYEPFGRGSLPPPYGVARVEMTGGLIVRGLLHPSFDRPEIDQPVVLAEIVLEAEDDIELTTYAFVPAGGDRHA